jgi:hypothetical protein
MLLFGLEFGAEHHIVIAVSELRRKSRGGRGRRLWRRNDEYEFDQLYHQFDL